jgi:NADH:ubiquinone oxidoreductase subunit 6 (subunit J)
MNEWVVWLFEGIVVGAALMILFSKSVFHAGLNLLIVVLCVGVIFGLYGSEFLFISQIMVYGGGILVLILFTTMVTARTRETPTKKEFSIPSLLAAAGVIVIMTSWVMALQPRGIPLVVRTSDLGTNLITNYSLPLEVSGILLLVSLIGAALSSMQKPQEP